MGDNYTYTSIQQSRTITLYSKIFHFPVLVKKYSFNDIYLWFFLVSLFSRWWQLPFQNNWLELFESVRLNDCYLESDYDTSSDLTVGIIAYIVLPSSFHTNSGYHIKRIASKLSFFTCTDDLFCSLLE